MHTECERVIWKYSGDQRHLPAEIIAEFNNSMSLDSWNVDMGSYVVHMVLYLVLSLPSLTLFAAACETMYTKHPLYGYRCKSSFDIVLHQADRTECQWRCLKIPNCSYINYNPESDQCEIGLGQCESLAPAIGVMVNVYWQPRDVCLHWGSYQQPGRVAFGAGSHRPAARIKHGEALVVGKYAAYRSNPFIFANNQGQRIIAVLGSGNVIEVLTTIASCPLFWVPYTGGNLLPSGVVVGGYLANGKAIYVARVLYRGDLACGYYNLDTEMAYYESGGARTSSTMEILVLI